LLSAQNVSTLITPSYVTTDIPARLDRLPWSRWHLRVIVALAVAWLLDGLEGSLGGSLAGALKRADTLAFTDAQLGLSSSIYLAGAVAGALLFGYLTDRFGRRRLFSWTLLLYLCATAATGLSWNLASFTFFRFLTGAGIGGEYSAINSAIDELVPARLRGRIDLWINGTFWLGIILGSFVATALLSPAALGSRLGWRLAFCSGLPLGAAVLWMRRYIPESPRWLISRGSLREADAVMSTIEAAVEQEHGPLPPVFSLTRIPAQPARTRVFALLAGAYRGRALLCFALMTAQAFFYNSVFFSLALVLLRYYGVSTDRVGLCFIPIACTNFLGPMLLGPLFDSVGRRTMIATTYCLSGAVLLASSLLFHQGALTLVTQLAWWAAAFFFASTAASSAYLSVSELFPQPVRATCIALFYAFGTLAGGVFGPLIFGHLTGSASRTPLLAGYAAGAAVMIAAGLAQAVWGVAAERKSLEALTFEPAAAGR
jgi:MFS family permease